MLLLASASPRRTELLDLMGIHHEVVEQKFDEDSVKDLDPIVCSQNIVKGKKIVLDNYWSDHQKKTYQFSLPILLFLHLVKKSLVNQRITITPESF